MSFNTKPIHIQTNLCIHLCVLTSGPPQVPLCAPTVTGPEVKTEKKNKKKMPTFSSHYTYKYIHANYNQSIFKQRSKLTQNT